VFALLQILPHQHSYTHKSLSYFSIHSLSVSRLSPCFSLSSFPIFTFSLTRTSHINSHSFPPSLSHTSGLISNASPLHLLHIFISHSSFSSVHPTVTLRLFHFINFRDFSLINSLFKPLSPGSLSYCFFCFLWILKSILRWIFFFF
jgi:hypothetical protein